MKNITIISDFSKTLSNGNKGTTWSILSDSGVLGCEYNKKREELYDKYHDFELSGNKEKTREWFGKHNELLSTSGLTKDILQSVIDNPKYLEAREGLKDFMNYIENNSIDVIIITSGITVFVEMFLDSLGIDRRNIQIFGNELVFNSKGECIDYREENVFCPLDNKSIFQNKININSSHKTVLLGDKKEDLQAYNSADVTIGFCKQKQGYDYDFGKDGNLREVIKIIQKIGD